MSNMHLGGGGRFEALKEKLATEPGVRNPGGLAAAIGRRIHGAANMAKWAKAGEERKEGK